VTWVEILLTVLLGMSFAVSIGFCVCNYAGIGRRRPQRLRLGKFLRFFSAPKAVAYRCRRYVKLQLFRCQH